MKCAITKTQSFPQTKHSLKQFTGPRLCGDGQFFGLLCTCVSSLFRSKVGSRPGDNKVTECRGTVLFSVKFSNDMSYCCWTHSFCSTVLFAGPCFLFSSSPYRMIRMYISRLHHGLQFGPRCSSGV